MTRARSGILLTAAVAVLCLEIGACDFFKDPKEKRQDLADTLVKKLSGGKNGTVRGEVREDSYVYLYFLDVPGDYMQGVAKQVAGDSEVLSRAKSLNCTAIILDNGGRAWSVDVQGQIKSIERSEVPKG